MSSSNRSTKKKSVSNISSRLKTKDLRIKYIDLTGIVPDSFPPYLFYSKDTCSFYTCPTIDIIGSDWPEAVEYDDLAEFFVAMEFKVLLNPQLYRAMAELLEVI